MEGYVNLFNMLRVGAIINIDDTSFKCELKGELLQGFLAVTVFLEASYSTNPAFKVFIRILIFGHPLASFTVCKKTTSIGKPWVTKKKRVD